MHANANLLPHILLQVGFVDSPRAVGERIDVAHFLIRIVGGVALAIEECAHRHRLLILGVCLCGESAHEIFTNEDFGRHEPLVGAIALWREEYHGLIARWCHHSLVGRHHRRLRLPWVEHHRRHCARVGWCACAWECDDIRLRTQTDGVADVVVEVVGAPRAEVACCEIAVRFKIVGKRDILIPLQQHIILVGTSWRNVGSEVVRLHNLLQEGDGERLVGSHFHRLAEHLIILGSNAQQIFAHEQRWEHSLAIGDCGFALLTSFLIHQAHHLAFHRLGIVGGHFHHEACRAVGDNHHGIHHLSLRRWIHGLHAKFIRACRQVGECPFVAVAHAHFGIVEIHAETLVGVGWRLGCHTACLWRSGCGIGVGGGLTHIHIIYHQHKRATAIRRTDVANGEAHLLASVFRHVVGATAPRLVVHGLVVARVQKFEIRLCGIIDHLGHIHLEFLLIHIGGFRHK